MKWARRIAGGLTGLLLVGALAVHLLLGDVASVFTSGAANLLCNAVFAADRDPELARQQEFERVTTPGRYLDLARTTVDLENETVRASLWGWQARTSVHREGLGCTTNEGISVEELRAQTPGVTSTLAPADPDVLWPEGEATLADDLPDGVDGAALDAAVQAAFDSPDPDEPRATRALVVVQGGRILAEAYADGYDEHTEHLSNSVAKSVTATLAGVLIEQGVLELDDLVGFDEWSEDPDDVRAGITVEHMLRMATGQDFDETYTTIESDVTMQYVGGDLADYMIDRPAVADPGDRWHYNTGNATLLSRVLQDAAAGDDFQASVELYRRELFDPLGMRDTIMTVDGTGTFVSGSAMYASARDYARVGQLYLQDGVWDGERLLPEGWAEFAATPTQTADGPVAYGTMFWLNWDGVSEERRHPELPDDTYFMNGHQGQHVVIIPSRDVVIARNGLTEFGNADIAGVTAAILEALP